MNVINENMYSEEVTKSDLLPLSFIEKTPYTGSKRGLRYRIEKLSGAGGPVMELSYWTTGMAYPETAAEDITKVEFPFDEEGLHAVISCLNDVLREAGI